MTHLVVSSTKLYRKVSIRKQFFRFDTLKKPVFQSLRVYISVLELWRTNSYCFIKGKICAPFSFSTIEIVSQTVLFFFPWSVVCTFCHNQQLRISKYVLQPFLHSQNTFERHFFVKRECMRALYDSFFSFCCCNFLQIGNTNLKVRLWWMNLGSSEFKVRHVKF